MTDETRKAIKEWVITGTMILLAACLLAVVIHRKSQTNAEKETYMRIERILNEEGNK